MSDNLPVRQPHVEPIQEPKETGKKKNVTLIISIVVTVQVILAVFVGIWLFKRGYQNAKAGTTEKIRKEAYETVYGVTEGAYHTSNRATIQLVGMEDKADLEVLQVDTSYLYVSDKEDKDKKLTIWYRMRGTGTYIVNLEMAEFIVDDERQQVFVKAPYPVVTNFKEGKKEELEYKDNRLRLFQGNTLEGVNLGLKMSAKAHNEMMADLQNNTFYFNAAKDSSVRLITNMIKALNPDMKDLKVSVEFY